MLLLPPAAPTLRTDARAERRAADRRRGAADPVGPGAVGDVGASARAAPDPAAERRSRKWGRRASDRAPDQVAGEQPARRPRAHAPLVAQLIATALGIEQTRARRRGKVEEAVALYLRKAPAVRPRGEA